MTDDGGFEPIQKALLHEQRSKKVCCLWKVRKNVVMGDCLRYWQNSILSQRSRGGMSHVATRCALGVLSAPRDQEKEKV